VKQTVAFVAAGFQGFARRLQAFFRQRAAITGAVFRCRGGGIGPLPGLPHSTEIDHIGRGLAPIVLVLGHLDDPFFLLVARGAPGGKSEFCLIH
jgi:hypothetical protein